MAAKICIKKKVAMKKYLQKIVDDLNNFSRSLDTKSMLVDKPWALIDSDFEIQKLIFKKNNELIMSKDGQVTMGGWEYLPAAKSLLIDRGKDKILCNEGFIDDGVLILKLDGTKNNFFVLANENMVPDLDVYKYLKELRYRNLNIFTRKLTDGRTLEIICRENENNSWIGNEVTFDAEKVEDGIYKLYNYNSKYLIENSCIMAIIHEVEYKTKDGLTIMVEQKNQYTYRKGENVWVNGKSAPDGNYRVKGGSNFLTKDGKIFKKSIF